MEQMDKLIEEMKDAVTRKEAKKEELQFLRTNLSKQNNSMEAKMHVIEE